ncbi:MAG TPA: hypothetical protein VKK79_19430, partial [Candidatus Lokiarchaeia archaeon]|nr:hypothetical protein [Candidatus Lokiarchaeia archaeon]
LILFPSTMNPPPSTSARDLPASLQGVESVLRYFASQNYNAVSIRTISVATKLSMRVTKNTLLHLEHLHHVERVMDKAGSILPKWKVTKLGLKVAQQLNESNLTVTNHQFLGDMNGLAQNFTIPADARALQEVLQTSQDRIVQALDNLRVEMSKSVGMLLNLGNLQLADFFGQLVSKVKNFRQQMTMLPPDPLKQSSIQRKGEKKRPVKSEEILATLAEIYFFNVLLGNQVDVVAKKHELITQNIASNTGEDLPDMGDISDDIQLVTRLLGYRASINLHNHNFEPGDLKKLLQNRWQEIPLSALLDISKDVDAVEESVKNIILKVAADAITETAKDLMPLVVLYRYIRDQVPHMRPSIELVEGTVNELADAGYLTGIKTIEEDIDHIFKYVQFRGNNISDAEHQLLQIAARLPKFSFSQLVSELNWPKEQVLTALDSLTNAGLLRHTTSFVEGDLWYIVK